jgi:hypothetical protein
MSPLACAAGLALWLGAGGALAQDSEMADELPFDEPLDLSIPLTAPTAPLHGLDPSKFIPKGSPGWTGKAGVDSRAALPDAAVRPEYFIPGRAGTQLDGVAWANITAPNMMILDQASLETRLDPMQQSKLGINLSRSVPIGSSMSLTWQQGYVVTHALPAPDTPANAIDSQQALRFTFLPAHTTVSLGAAVSSANDKWLRSMSAEQKLFGGPLSITGTITETATGGASKGLKAGFKQTW